MKSKMYMEETEAEKIEREKRELEIEKKVEDLKEEMLGDVEYAGYRQFHRKVLQNNVIAESLEAKRQDNIKKIVDDIKDHCDTELETLAKKLCISNIENFKTYIASQLINIVKSDIDYVINFEKEEEFALRKYAYVKMKEENKNRTL